MTGCTELLINDSTAAGQGLVIITVSDMRSWLSWSPASLLLEVASRQQAQVHAAFISIHRRIIAAQKELGHMGGPVAATRGGMVHTVLRLCCAFEDALTKAIDGGKDGEGHPGDA